MYRHALDTWIPREDREARQQSGMAEPIVIGCGVKVRIKNAVGREFERTRGAEGAGRPAVRRIRD